MPISSSLAKIKTKVILHQARFVLSIQAVVGRETQTLDDTALGNVLDTMQFFSKTVLCKESP